MNEENKFRIGDRVMYRSNDPDYPTEFGTVTSISETYVFVLFDEQPIYARGKACYSRDLAKLTLSRPPL
jgi:hypothetical protein